MTSDCTALPTEKGMNMFNIRLYRFNKKTNSTKKPPVNTGSVYTCTMKTSSSIISPVIDIKYPVNQIPDFNYAYISEFKRYYYVTDVVYSIGVWTLSLSVDVLASFRDDILNSTQYVLRSYSNYDNTLVDGLYTSKLAGYYDKCEYSYYEGIKIGGTAYPNGVHYTNIAGGSSGSTSNYFNISISQGDFVIGVVGNNTTGVDYYCMGYTAFKQFVSAICNLVPSNMTDLANQTANAIYEPLQYITMVRWYPQVASFTTGTAVHTLYIGADTVTISGNIYPMDMNGVPEYYMEIDIPRHPKASDYPYMNQSPFAEYNLFFQPFGNIPLDATKIDGEEELYITWTIDYATGISHLKVRPYSHLERNPAVIVDVISEYGVTIPLSSLVMDVKTGLGIAGLNWLSNTIDGYKANKWSSAGSKSAGNSSAPSLADASRGIGQVEPSDNKSMLDTVIDAIAGALGQVKSVGTAGSFLSYNSGKPYIYAFFYDQCEQYPELFGRPSCKKLKLQNLSGYCLCQNAVVNYSSAYPNESEKNAVLRYLNTGIYLEN